MWLKIQEFSALLNRAISEYAVRGRAYAVQEYEYRSALSKRLVELRAEGMAVTHLLDIAKGESEIAKLRMERDIAESLYKSCQEAINGYKVQIRILEGQLQREWGRTDESYHFGRESGV